MSAVVDHFFLSKVNHTISNGIVIVTYEVLNILKDNQGVKFKNKPEEYLPHIKFTLPTRRNPPLYLNSSIY